MAALEQEGVAIRPGAAALEMAVDKAHMRSVLDAAGVPVPVVPHHRRRSGRARSRVVLRYRARVAADPEVGPGWLRRQRASGRCRAPTRPKPCCGHITTQIVVEELVPLDAELAVMVARSPSGSSAVWPAVETAQVGGVCREVLVPGRLDHDLVDAAAALGQKVAEIAGAVGVMAVELFWAEGRLLVNEVATRPHNSGHWTMEGAVTSQFENHVRAVLDLPLGSTAAQHPQVASVNVFGGPSGEDPARLLSRGLSVEGAHIHLYGKDARPGRKLGHVTVCGDEAEVVRSRAWTAALALGTPAPDGLVLPAGALPRRTTPEGGRDEGRAGRGDRDGQLVGPPGDAGRGRDARALRRRPRGARGVRPPHPATRCSPSVTRRPAAACAW